MLEASFYMLGKQNGQLGKGLTIDICPHTTLGSTGH